MQGIKSLTQGPINRQLFNLAILIMATSFVRMAYSLTDMAWVGRLESETVAAVGSVGILTWMFGSIPLLNKIGSEISVGQSIGAQNYEDARCFALHNIIIALVISLCWDGPLFLFAHPVIGIYGLEAHITENAIAYPYIISTGLPFIFLSAAFTGIYNAAGGSKVPFYINDTGPLFNIILDPLFISGFGLSINGATYATWISQATVFGIFIYQLCYRSVLLERFPFFTRLRKKYAHRVLKLGLPITTLNTLFAPINMFLCRTASEQGGHIRLMTFMTGRQIEAITWSTSQGFSTALSALITQDYVAGRMDRVIKSWCTTLLMTSVFGTLRTLLFVLFGNEVFALFVPEQAAYEAGGIFLRIDDYSQLFMMLEITTQGVFYGIGRTIPPAIIGITCNYMRIPLAILFVRMGMGIEGIWQVACVTAVAKGLISAGWSALIKRKVLSHPVV